MKQAASLILCKPNGTGLFDVLMVKRSAKGTFKSIYAFPGGAVDECDSNPAYSTANTLPLSNFRVAALREAFEECGVTHKHIITTHPPLANKSNVSSTISLPEWQSRVRADAKAYVDFTESLAIPLPLPSLVHWAHWITSAIEKRRFDTHFFLAALDTAAPSFTVAPDNTEITETEWISPKDAISAFKDGRIRLIPPQFTTMMELQRYTFEDVCNLVKGETTRRVPYSCQPEPYLCNVDGKVLLLPGDVKHTAIAEMEKSGFMDGIQKGAKNRLKFGWTEGVVTSIEIIATGGHNAMGALDLSSKL
ncbi:UNVERIFIED_CONTAM: hypothetical protein HDU68_001181 [Siphonaria sp. JEL0065]|nr:hypothetical protein HDU68_001181 [Siphonaria sp. JEL0065]